MFLSLRVSETLSLSLSLAISRTLFLCYTYIIAISNVSVSVCMRAHVRLHTRWENVGGLGVYYVYMYT